MVALPKTVLDRMRMKKYPSKFFTTKDFLREFAIAGYGRPKAVKWLQYFIENEIIVEVDQSNFTCIWWNDAKAM